MTFRALSENDLSALISAKEYFSDAWDKDMLLSAFKTKNFSGVVAESEGRVVGFITYTAVDDFADINDLFVFPEYRRRGIAQGLISAFIAAAKQSGAKKCFLEVRKSNAAAIRLYLSAGFKYLSERKAYYGDGETAAVYIKEI